MGIKQGSLSGKPILIGNLRPLKGLIEWLWFLSEKQILNCCSDSVNEKNVLTQCQILKTFIPSLPAATFLCFPLSLSHWSLFYNSDIEPPAPKVIAPFKTRTNGDLILLGPKLRAMVSLKIFHTLRLLPLNLEGNLTSLVELVNLLFRLSSISQFTRRWHPSPWMDFCSQLDQSP